MKKMASIPLAFAVCLLVVSAAFAQSASISKQVSTDLNAFADGGLTTGFGEVGISLNASLTANGPDTLSGFIFTPSAFTFFTDTLQQTEFHFADVNSASVNHTFASGPLAGDTFNVTWTPVAGIAPTQSTTVRNQDGQGGTFHFSQTAREAPATISGTVAGIGCCSFSFGSISQTATQVISVIHP